MVRAERDFCEMGEVVSVCSGSGLEKLLDKIICRRMLVSKVNKQRESLRAYLSILEVREFEEKGILGMEKSLRLTRAKRKALTQCIYIHLERAGAWPSGKLARAFFQGNAGID